MIANQFLNLKLRGASKVNIDESLDRDSFEMNLQLDAVANKDDPLMQSLADTKT